MALIKCPNCGKQISDKAAICPNCRTKVQKILKGLLEKEQHQRKKRKKRIVVIISIMFIVSAIATSTYLYSLYRQRIEYQQISEHYLEQCEKALNDGNYGRGTKYIDELKERSLTPKQEEQLFTLQKKAFELLLQDSKNISF